MKATTFLKSLFVFTLLLLTFSCQPKKLDTKAESEKLMQASRDWSAAAASKDLEKTLSYWTDNAILYSAGEPELKGKKAIRKMVEASLKDANFSISWEPISAEVSESGDMGYLLENSKIVMKDSTVKEKIMTFKGVTIWKKQKDGTWKNAIDIMSPDSLK
jgi:ketosteroid isomerase-like protein